MKKRLRNFRCLVSVILLLGNLFKSYGQNTKSTTQIEQTLEAIDTAFIKEDTGQFSRLMPLEDVRSYYSELVNKKVSRRTGAHRILQTYEDSAFVLLTGVPNNGNSGDETNSALHYSGIYLLKKTGLIWYIKRKVAFDRVNEITSQHIKLDINPGEGIAVSDTLTINVKDEIGFVVRLNHRADFTQITLNGQEVSYSFGGGLLWIGSRLKRQQQLVLQYTLAVERDDKNVNSGYFGTTYGHVRNQYVWHPFFSYSSPNDRAEFVVHCSLPANYPLSTSLPQRERIQGEVRLIEAHSENPTFALSIYYDKDWQVSRHQKGKTDLVIFATKDFKPARDSLYHYFSETSNLLNEKFGPARSTYLGIVQDRSGGGNGWKNRSNNTIIASASGSYLIVRAPQPRAIFGHEVAHGWTTPVGPAANFLSEGWATYCESYLLAKYYTDTIVKTFFASQRANYLSGEYENKSSLTTDYSNNGISYGKGAWIFYMLDKQMGNGHFTTAMQKFIRSDKQDVHSFIQIISREVGKDMTSAIKPWLEGKTIPKLSIHHDNQRLIVRQEGDLFVFPLTIRFVLKDGSYINKTMIVNSYEQDIDISKMDLKSYKLDPDAQLLFSLNDK